MEKVQNNFRLLKNTTENKTNTYAYSKTLLPQARHVIRICMDFPGMAFEMYNKRQFVKRFGITMYVTRDNANLPLKRIMRSLFFTKIPPSRLHSRQFMSLDSSTILRITTPRGGHELET